MPIIDLNADPIMQWFTFDHLPPDKAAVSRPFCELAVRIYETIPRSAERTAALRKLLESKDCTVRASMLKPALDGVKQVEGFISEAVKETKQIAERIRAQDAELAALPAVKFQDGKVGQMRFRCDREACRYEWTGGPGSTVCPGCGVGTPKIVL